ncbi:MAG TPA: SDR family oxidoreductase [Verrucomicrobiae bacterium]|jgi:NAD(P)-dependent dehydrogenase (short-subunit alcohol dehydrogenase family)|nr:SDR family oxidoreductase [Verrucomicrobiae bacterium]
MLLENKIALVTGSTNNIGLAIARAFAREGAKVIVHSRHGGEAGKIAAEIAGDSFAADLSRPEEIGKLFSHVEAKHRRLDILVNTVAHSTKNGILEVTFEEWSEIMAINLTAYFLCIQRAAKMMQASGGGAIVNVSAASGERGSPGTAVYSISKGAINALTRQAAVDLAPHNIRVNGIIAGIIGTPLGRKDMGNRKTEYDTIPLKRIGQPEEVAEAAVFLTSEKSSYITNVILPVDGGRMNSMGSATRS